MDLIKITVPDEVPPENQEDNKLIGTIFHVVENYLNENYDIRHNSISLDIEISKKETDSFVSINENSLWIEIQKAGIKIPLNSLIAILKSDFVERYNPIYDYFETINKTPYNPDTEPDYITQYLDYLTLANDDDLSEFRYHWKKWVARAARCTLDPKFFNKQCFVLSDRGVGQNIGKSSWIRYLMPENLENYIAENIDKDKDSRVALVKNMIINLEELSVLHKKNIDDLKELFSKVQINERLPYDRKNSILPRIASFIGSTNQTTFLQDETGSVRWLIFTIKSIDWSYKNKFNIDNLWRQAYFLAFSFNFDMELTKEDIINNEKRNENYTIVREEQELIQHLFEKPFFEDEVNTDYLTATEILKYISAWSKLPRLNNIWVGKAINKLGYKREKRDGIYKYYIKYRFPSESYDANQNNNNFFEPT